MAPMPMWLCQLMWQWSTQYPGLALNLIRVNPPSGTWTVSLSGGSFKFRAIWPFLFISMTFVFSNVLPVTRIKRGEAKVKERSFGRTKKKSCSIFTFSTGRPIVLRDGYVSLHG